VGERPRRRGPTSGNHALIAPRSTISAARARDPPGQSRSGCRSGLQLIGRPFDDEKAMRDGRPAFSKCDEPSPSHSGILHEADVGSSDLRVRFMGARTSMR